MCELDKKSDKMECIFLFIIDRGKEFSNVVYLLKFVPDLHNYI
jgi:hypothetical protein